MKKLLAGILFATMCVFSAGSVWAFPGVLQLASRSGFWANDFPDTTIYLQHFYYYSADEMFDDSGDSVDIQTTKITASFTRLVRPWHFGDEKQFQYILEGIIPLYNISGEEDGDTPGYAVSGLGDPMVYTSLGWNNPGKTTHLQAFLVVNFPLGDEDVSLTNNAYAIMPGVAWEQRIGSVWLDASAGYWNAFEDLSNNGNESQSYFELNGIATYRFTKAWVYLQADYTKRNEGKLAGNGLDNDGYNFMLAPAVGFVVQPNMTLDFKFGFDVDGENTMKGQSVNVRYLWVF